MKSVLIIQALMKQYRVSFYKALEARLVEQGIVLKVVYGQPSPDEATKNDWVELNSQIGRQVKNFWIANHKLLYQPVWKMVFNSDLVIVEQANKHLINWPLIISSRLGLKKVAFWGHGWSRKVRALSLNENLKRRLVDWPTWWFAYTRGVADYIVAQGMPAERVTVVQNSVDTRSFSQDISSVTDYDLRELKERMGIPQDALIGIYCGGLFKEKCLSFLIDACSQINANFPQFHLIVIGDGPERETISSQTSLSWLHYLGPKFGLEKAICFTAADIFLCPGLVGLAILDAFAAGLPLITTDIFWHSPEIEYLEHDKNGMITNHGVNDFVGKVCNLFNDKQKLQLMQANALSSGKKYSIENMADNFADGISRCLAL